MKSSPGTPLSWCDHTSTLVQNESSESGDLGQRTEARDLYEQVIAGYTSQLGADHTDTLRAK